MKHSLVSMQQTNVQANQPSTMWHDCGSDSFSAYNASIETNAPRGEITIRVREGSGFA